MDTLAPKRTLRVLQEDWAPFQNIHHTVRKFTQATGIEVEVVLKAIPEFWELTQQSFSQEQPIFDLIGADEIMLMQFARVGWAEPLDSFVKNDGYDLNDFEPAVLDALSYHGHLYGLPYAAVANVLIYRQDLFEKYGFVVPQTMDELTQVAIGIQNAVRAEDQTDFYGITLRGAPSCGLNFWLFGSTWAPAWGAKWYDDEGCPTLNTPEMEAALSHFVELIQKTGPPKSWQYSFVECMNDYALGKAAMVIEPANEASTLFSIGGEIADATLTAVIPSGPLGTRHAGLYCPPYAIPSRSQLKEFAWELAKLLCSREAVLDDALQSGFVEVARRSVLDDPKFETRFRKDLIDTTRATRLIARAERPTPRQGMLVGDLIGEEITRVLTGEQNVSQALENAQKRVADLGKPD